MWLIFSTCLHEYLWILRTQSLNWSLDFDDMLEKQQNKQQQKKVLFYCYYNNQVLKSDLFSKYNRKEAQNPQKCPIGFHSFL